MRKAVTLVAGCVLVTGIAAAQMKPKAAAPGAPKTPLAVSGAQANYQASIESVKRVSTEEAWKMAARGDAILVDVRSNEQFTLGHIRGALSIPGSQLMTRLKELPPGKMIITYCA